MSERVTDYLCFSVDSGSILDRIGDLYAIEGFLRANEKHDIADEVLVYVKDLQTIERRLLAIGRRMYGLLYAAEGWAYGERDESELDAAWNEFVYGESD